MEYWDILNRDGEQTGRQIRRDSFHHLKSDEYHLVVHIWVVSTEQKFLVQRRSPDRVPMPGQWAATGGSVLTGEASCAAAIRELHEELGIVLKENEIHYLGRVMRKNSMTDLWYAGVDAALESLVLQKEEVADARWVSAEQLRSMIANGIFHDYGDDYFKMVFPLAGESY